MPRRQTPPPLPALWLLSDPRTDARFEAALGRLPRGAGVIFRHYHLPPDERLARFRRIACLCRRRGLLAVWAGDVNAARRARADGAYGPAPLLAPGAPLLRLVTAHSLAELAAAGRSRAQVVLLSPVFPTRSHPGEAGLGPLRWLLLARRSPAPVAALGGMSARRARRLPGFAWAAIDGLAAPLKGAGFPRILDADSSPGA